MLFRKSSDEVPKDRPDQNLSPFDLDEEDDDDCGCDDDE